ncbi:FtsK/SpoIIIE domain-containing protein [Terribacillus sp. 179-K 1B1 HS]|uniref:FtsK/SpoIIIE domain-containing protein n=1 Tax=Terribacillus sp. 179-K 1B1 HS TaxID=3142388 RepID=UPI0039A19BD9
MLFEIGAAMLTTSAVTALFNLPMSRRRKLRIIFRRNGFMRQVGKDMRQPIEGPSTKTEQYTEYSYVIPLGLTLTDNLAEAISAAFSGGPVAVKSENGRISIRFYERSLPDNLPYYAAPKMAEWKVPIGETLDGPIAHDFDKVPHMTVAGATRQGKTVFLKALITQLTENHADNAELYLIDMKGGLEFGKLEQLSNVAGVASSVEEACALLTALQRQFNGDLRAFRRKGYANILDTDIARRRFIFVDEAAQLTPDKSDDKATKQTKNECLAILSEITRVAGALGYRLIYATQYPTADTLPRQIKQNSDAKITFRLPTSVASNVAIDESGAEKLTMPGRLIYRTHERVEAQGYYLSDEEMRRRLKLRKGGERNANSNAKHDQPKMDSAPGGDIITFI